VFFTQQAGAPGAGAMMGFSVDQLTGEDAGG